MKPTTKKLLIGAGIFLTGLAVWGYYRAKRLKAVFDAMTIKPVRITNLKVTLTSITFNLDILLQNNTTEDFNVRGYSASLRRVLIYYKGQFLGQAVANITAISIPKLNQLVIHNLPVQVATVNILSNIMTITELRVEDLTIIAEVEALGRTYMIEN